MLGLKIEALEISVITAGGTFSALIPFKEGLNIIRANNSSGKSTCINAIAYGLGLEAILGPSRKRPFPKSLYEVIYKNKKDETPYFVKSSNVRIVVKNRNAKEATLIRDIEGNSNKVSIISENKKQDYFLGSAGEVGSAKSERGFHHWLAEFIGWTLPDVVTFEGKETKLYLECIFPLFFIEQKRGWSEIQANIPTNYGIRNVKKNAAEFCLGFDSFEQEKKVYLLKAKVDAAEVEWNNIRSSAYSIADFNSVRVSRVLDIEKAKETRYINFSYLENDIFISLQNQAVALKKLIGRLNEEADERQPNGEQIEAQNSIIRKLQRETENTSRGIENALLSLSETDKKISKLKHDLNQYQQLKRLKSVGGSSSISLDISKCPVCDSAMYDTLGGSSTQRSPMTLEENTEFLKNQVDFFISIKNKTIFEIQDLQASSKLIMSRLGVEQDRLNALRLDFEDVYGAAKSILREKIQAEMLLKEVERLQVSEKDINEQLQRIYNTWDAASGALKLARKNVAASSKYVTISKLEFIVRKNLESFQFNTSAINTISVSHQTLRPEQEGYDIVAETSASDYIRVIWAYTLGLLELAGSEEEIKHGGFVVFDEPRQHEASKISFVSLIEKAAESKLYGGQVIFATSMEENELNEACVARDLNVHFFDDYILKLTDVVVEDVDTEKI
ncbi:MAG: AAA family ATPase [Pseudomonadales bacterium]